VSDKGSDGVSGAAGRATFEYFVLRCVPRTDREEFVNVGVVVYSQALGFLGAACEVNEERLRGLAPSVDVPAIRSALEVLQAVCRGDDAAGPAARQTPRERFGWLSAPRSTVIQPGPVHAGLTDDAPAELAHLLETLVT
jgi:hypothetical protein